MRTGLAVTATGAIAVLVGLSIAGRSRLAGPVLFRITSTHGIHSGDAVSVVIGLIGIAAVWLQWRRP